MNASIWGTQLAKAQIRAKNAYPGQPERARKMTDEQMGIWDGPYALEQLSFSQIIQKVFGKRFDDN